MFGRWNLIKDSVGIKWHQAFSWCWRELTRWKQHLGRGRVSYLFYWFSICEALHIYTVGNCTQLIAQAGIQIASHFSCYCDNPTCCLRNQSMCCNKARAVRKKYRQSPLCASTEAKKMCRTISFDFPAVQLAAMPDSTVPQDQGSRATPTTGRSVKLSPMIKLGKFWKIMMLATFRALAETKSHSMKFWETS